MAYRKKYLLLKRLLDIFLASIVIIILFIPLLIIGVLIKLTSKGPIIHWSERVGVNNSSFKMAKFRTMKVGTPQVAAHLLEEPEKHITFIGKVLRKFCVDELPQLYNILKGDMTLIGPRPALFNYYDLISQRTERNIHTIVPGLTGWAQINSRSELSTQVNVNLDEYYLENRSLTLDSKIIFLTILFLLFFKSQQNKSTKISKYQENYIVSKGRFNSHSYVDK